MPGILRLNPRIEEILDDAGPERVYADCCERDEKGYWLATPRWVIELAACLRCHTGSNSLRAIAWEWLAHVYRRELINSGGYQKCRACVDKSV